MLSIFDYTTKQQRSNLRKLEKVLRREYYLSENRVQFDMGLYFFCPELNLTYDDRPSKAHLVKKKHFECETTACALGIAAIYKIGISEKTSFSSFGEYADEAFGRECFYWIFSPDWKQHDNTEIGAARRIRYALRKGVPDQSEISQMFLHEKFPYCVPVTQKVE